MLRKRARTILAWSGGKDSAWSAVTLARDPSVELVGLLTTTREGDGRVVMHRTPRAALLAQAQALGLPVWEVALPDPCPNAVYEVKMGDVIARARAEQIEAIAFGDLFLADLRAYREDMLRGTGLRAVFPLWGQDTGALARAMIAGGLRATVVAVDLARLSAAWLGREFDRDFLAELPADVDPCGERGEFHTFVTDLPGFARPLALNRGDVFERDGHAFLDVALAARPDD
ncbi:ATP-binding protein [Nannocystis punicea]|uniref:ATP-binding protein n=1 Tax=Nannocystis punicea TaxID=2995304 RepID=A0ABY7GSA6_9BACT|nr:ATP-binding protein [Nannocystis poenicansa]WAS89827.1 ATP-binding protein [Nannocystis poenicansa]